MSENLTRVAQSNEWYNVAMSGNGQYRMAAHRTHFGKIWQSHDYGVSWNESDLYAGPSQGGKYTQPSGSSIAISGNGQYRAVVIYNGNIWQSNDYGESWNPYSNINKKWISIAINSNGQYHVAVVYNGQIWQSDDYGKTWNPYSNVSGKWNDIAMSGNGQYLMAARWAPDGSVWQSDDYGKTWNDSDFYADLEDIDSSMLDETSTISIAMSGNGQYRAAVIYTGIHPSYPNWSGPRGCWESNDYGVTWKKNIQTDKKNWYDIAISSDGQYRTAVVMYGNIWNWHFCILGNHYKAIQAQPTSNVAQEVCCPPGTTTGLQEIQRKEEDEKKQRDLFIQLVTRNRLGLANKICYS